MRSFNQWLVEAKKTLKKEDQVYPVKAGADIVKDKNASQTGFNDKDDVADRTEGFMSPKSNSNSKPNASTHSKAANAPANASSSQNAANAAVAKNMAASIAAKKQQEKQAEDQKKIAQKNAEAAKAKAIKNTSASQTATTVSKPTKAPVQEELVSEGRPRKDSNPDEGPSKHPINQLRLVLNTRGMHHFEHKNGKKSAISPPTAHKLLSKHDNMKTPAEKDEYAQRIHHSPESLRDVIHGKAAEHKPKISLGGTKNVGGVKKYPNSL
jgi:hypothetical protein